MGFTLVKVGTLAILRPMTAAPQTGQASSNGKYLLLLVLVVLTPLIFTWLTTNPSNNGNFDRLLNAGKTYYDAGNAQKAIEAFSQALLNKPTETDLLLNLANAYRLSNEPNKIIKFANEALAIDHNLGAGHFLIGCAYLRLNQNTNAIQALQQAYDIDNTVGAVGYLLGKAKLKAGNLEDAILYLEEVATYEEDHLSAAYTWSQALMQAGKPEEAKAALELHQERIANKQMPDDQGAWEQCIYTEVKIPFKLDQPLATGIDVKFTDDTERVFAKDANHYAGPFGVIDFNHNGNNSLFVRTSTNTFRTLMNTNGVFEAFGKEFQAITNANYSQCLVGDLNNDRFDDILMIGDQGSHAYRFATNGLARDMSRFSRLSSLKAIDAVIADIDFTGKLDLLAIQPENAGLKVFRNLGSLYFKDISKTSGIPTEITGALKLVMDDWNNDDMLDIIIPREKSTPIYLEKIRGNIHSQTNSLPTDNFSQAIATGDLNNDLRVDLVSLIGNEIKIHYNGIEEMRSLQLTQSNATDVKLFDYDNDGWLDIFVIGNGLESFRNKGLSGFENTSIKLGLSSLNGTNISQLSTADIDRDGDSDLILATDSGLKYLRNDGGNKNLQLKIRLYGNRSNASGLGIQVEGVTGGLRFKRTAQTLPVEIGVGSNTMLNSLTARWFDLSLNNIDVEVNNDKIVTLTELILPTGSCPYLYCWDGKKFRFITDLLGASPLGLPIGEKTYIDADPNEIVWIGDETNFKPINDKYRLQITEELREILYLDHAKIIMVDVPEGMEIHPNTKLLPNGPYPPASLIALTKYKPLQHATRSDGLDVTSALQHNDDNWLSPAELREPQLRGLAKPYSVELNFGTIDTSNPLALAMTGWLHFGGGMANMSASHRPELPFPFPVIEAQRSDGKWQKVEVSVGAPVGKTKTIVVDLEDKLPSDLKKLRLSMAFEIHWNRIALMKKTDMPTITDLHVASTDLHWHGYGKYENLPNHLPLTPIYSQTNDEPNWRITPSGWVTRYGDVNELIASKDNQMALIAAGDGLTLDFDANLLPKKTKNKIRNFFLFICGWDKDADFHVSQGWAVEPLPWHGMNYQIYGREPRPKLNDAWIKKYNTRWIGPRTYKRINRITQTTNK